MRKGLYYPEMTENEIVFQHIFHICHSIMVFEDDI